MPLKGNLCVYFYEMPLSWSYCAVKENLISGKLLNYLLVIGIIIASEGGFRRILHRHEAK